MSSSSTQQPPPPRERGTLKHTLPKHPILPLTLICATCSTLATMLSLHSLPSEYDTSHYIFGTVAFLGAASALVGIIFGDSLVHSVGFGCALFVARCWSSGGSVDVTVRSLVEVFPLLVVPVLACFCGTRPFISNLEWDSLFNGGGAMIIYAACLIPFTTVVYLVLASEFTIKATGLFSVIPSCTIAFITMALMHYYNQNRAHKHGNLLTPEMKSHSVFVAIAILLSTSVTAMDEPYFMVIVVFLLGSMMAILMGLFLGGVADSWYVVGSGQFQMVSLDSLGMIVYFFWPVVILFFRFVDKYGGYIGGNATIVVGYLKATGILTDGPLMSGDDIFSFSFVILLAMITAVGVPLLNALCPIGGYLYSRAYTHGQPNTKKVALCISYSDLPRDSTTLWAILADKKKEGQTTCVLNIFVTLEDLKLHAAKLKVIAAKGHVISLEPTEFGGLSLFQRTAATCNIEFAHYEYTEVFGHSPHWLFAKSVDTIGRHPSLFHKARDLGMKVVYWSTLVNVSSDDKLTSTQFDDIVGDCEDKNGGSIIYIKADSSSSNLTTPICDLVGMLDDFTFESLSVVARDDPTMVL